MQSDGVVMWLEHVDGVGGLSRKMVSVNGLNKETGLVKRFDPIVLGKLTVIGDPDVVAGVCQASVGRAVARRDENVRHNVEIRSRQPHGVNVLVQDQSPFCLLRR